LLSVTPHEHRPIQLLVFHFQFRTSEETAAASSTGDTKEIDEKEALAKKIKGLKKKIRAIDDLESKAGSGGLNEDQLAKISKRGDLLAEMSAAEDAFAALSL
jgi:uncharacterized protein with WD repeat